MNMFLAIFNTCFVQFRSVQVLLDPESSAILCVYVQLMAFWYLLSSSMQLTYITQRDGVEKFVRNHMELMENIWD